MMSSTLHIAGFLAQFGFYAGGVGRLNDHISDYEPLHLQSTYTASIQHKIAAEFDFNAFGR